MDTEQNEFLLPSLFVFERTTAKVDSNNTEKVASFIANDVFDKKQVAMRIITSE